MSPRPAPASAPDVLGALAAGAVTAAEAARRELRARISAAISAAADLAAGGGGAADAAAYLEKEGIFGLVAGLSPIERAGFAKLTSKMTGIPLPDVKKAIAAGAPAAEAVVREIGERPRVGGALSFSSAAAVAIPVVVEGGADGERDEVYIAVGAAGGRGRVVARPDEARRILGVEFSTVPSPGTLPHRWRGWSAWAEGAPAPAWAEVIDAVRAELLVHVEFVPEVNRDVVAAWIVATYFHPLCVSFPFLHFYGDPGSGKSQALSVVARLAWNAEKVIDVSAPTLYRLAEETAATLLFDEGDALSAKEKERERSLILGAFDRGNTAILQEVDEDGATMRSRRFSIYSPRAFCTMREMPSWAMTDRAIRIVMLRALGDQGKATVTDDSADWWGIRDRLYRLTLDRWREFAAAYESARAAAPANRTGLRWAPLLAVAALAGDAAMAAALRRRMAEDEVEHLGEDPLRDALVLGLWCLVRGEPTGVEEVLDEARGVLVRRPVWRFDVGAGGVVSPAPRRRPRADAEAEAFDPDDVIELEPSAIYAAAGAFLPPLPVGKNGEVDAKAAEGRRRRAAGVLRKLGIRPAVGADGRAKRRRHGRERLKATTFRHVFDLLRRWPDLDADVPAAGYAAEGEDGAAGGEEEEGGDRGG